MATWPSFMPQSPLLDGYSEDIVDTRATTEVDQGLALIRNRFTAAPVKVVEEYIIDKSTLSQFETWFKEDTKRGAISFIKPEAKTQTNFSFRFDPEETPYQVRPVADKFRLTINLELLP